MIMEYPKGGNHVDEEYGRLEIRLIKLLEERGISKNKLSHKAEMNWKQIDNYCNNNIARLDTFVLCKICAALNCKIEDLLTYIPPNQPHNENHESSSNHT